MVCLLAAAAPTYAQTFESIGVRAMGMGGAHVAVAEDATAIWWNPAGLATGPGIFSASIELSRFETTRGGFFGVPPPATRSSFFIGAGALPLGLSYVRTSERYAASGPADEGLVREFTTHQAGVTVLQSITDTIVAGATLKYVRGSAKSGPLTSGDLGDSAGALDAETGHAFTADFGVMAVAGLLKAGVTFRNVTSPGFEAADGTRFELPWQARAGVSYAATPSTLIALDLDLRSIEDAGNLRRLLALGGEHRFSRLALRAGARFDTIGALHPLATVGGSYAVRNGVWVDVWVAAGAREADRGWGVAGRIAY